MKSVAEYHKKRRAFVILPNSGVLLSEPSSILSHKEILMQIGLPKEKISDIMQNYPRGYFLDNTLVMYQGDNIKEGASWELKPENFQAVKKVFADLEHLLNLNANTQIYLGVKSGKLGTVWEQYNQVDISFFK